MMRRNKLIKNQLGDNNNNDYSAIVRLFFPSLESLFSKNLYNTTPTLLFNYNYFNDWLINKKQLLFSFFKYIYIVFFVLL